MSTFVKFNANPFGMEIGDCVIRALVAATACGYRTICQELGVEYLDGRGIYGGVGLEAIDKFAHKTKKMKQFKLEYKEEYGPLSVREYNMFMDYRGFKLSKWMDMLKNDPKFDRIVFLTKFRQDDDIPKGNTKDFHCVYGNVKSGKYYDIADSGDTIVFAAYKVNNNMRTDRESPEYFKNEQEQLNKEHQEYLRRIRK